MWRVLLLLLLTGCTISTGGYYVPPPPLPEPRPHPYVSFAVKGELGPVELLHAPLSSRRPTLDLTRLSVNYGPRLGNFHPTLGLGWALFREWGPCDSRGLNCEHYWFGSATIGLGLEYQIDRGRLSTAVHCYDNNTPLTCTGAFMVGLRL